MTKVISFYSDVNEEKYYSKCAERLKEDCSRLSIDLYLEEKKSLGSYRNNCLSKPQFIKDKLEQFKEPLLSIRIQQMLMFPFPRRWVTSEE